MKRAKSLDLSKTTIQRVVVEGVTVDVRLDALGRPISLGAGHWAGDTQGERRAKMAIEIAKRHFQAAAASGAKRGGQAIGAKARRDNTAWMQEWLEAAYLAAPDAGAEALAQRARQLIVKNGRGEEIPDSTRKKISRHQAAKFLATKRTAP